MAGIQSGGIGSGLDINGLVSQLVSAEGQTKFARIERQEIAAQAKLSGLSSLKGALSEFQSAVSGLRSAAQLGGRTANNTNNDIFSVTVDEHADKGSYQIEVLQLAQAHKLATGSFAETTTTVGTGTLTFQFGTYNSGGNTFTLNGDKGTKTVTIDSSNNTVEGIRDAVNNAAIGVTATVINDGSGQRLVFSSDDLGADNSLKISVNDDDGNDTNASGLSQLAYDPTSTAGNGKNLTQTQEAIDAHLKVDGIDVYTETNTVTGIIDGLTLNLKKAEIGTTSTATVNYHTSNTNAKVANFVKAFNAMVTTLKDLTRYDPETKKSGILNGDSTARGVESQIRNIISDVVNGLGGNYRALSDIGITTTAKGMLNVNTTKLGEVINADFFAVGRLFASDGSTSDSLVNFVSSTDDTLIGDYNINITTAASQGTYVGSAAANTTIVEGVNDTLVLTVDGQTATVALSAGTYTASELAAEVQSRINGASDFASNGIGVLVTESSGVLTLTSKSYGSSSSVEITGGSGQADLVGGAPTTTTGTDVEGTINGVTATGSGQYLTGTGNASGLKIEVKGNATGDRGTINFTRGVADRIFSVLDDYLGSNNVLDERTEIINDRIKSYAGQREAISRRLESYQTRLLAQFTALDKLVSNLRSTSEFLTGQLAALPGPVNNNAKKR